MFTESLTMGNNFSVEIQTTDNRGQTPEEVAERCVNKIIGVSNNAHPAIREQAIAFRKEMEKVVAIYMRQAIKSDRTTVYNAIKDSGNPKLAEYIRRM
jgi:DNA-binding phage protein|tara:strand:+ start:2088 stop:2381 length:294 start_codon:yes stop_codon:yes gene_type:complete